MKKFIPLILAAALCLPFAALAEDAVSSASVADFYGQTALTGDDLMNAINSFSGFYLVCTTNPDGSANAALFVADHNQRGEAEVFAALHNLGHAVEGDQALFEFAYGLFTIPAIPTFVHRHAFIPSLEVQAGFAGSRGQGGNAPGVEVAAAVKDHVLDALGQSTLSNQQRRSWSAHPAGPE